MNRKMDERLEILKKIKGLFGDILGISTQQLGILEQEEEQAWSMDVILDLLDNRQHLLERIEELDSILKTSLENPQVDFNQELYGILQAQIHTVIKEIQANDLIIQTRMEKGMQMMSSKLSQTRENKKAQLAYDHGGVCTPAWFFDKKH